MKLDFTLFYSDMGRNSAENQRRYREKKKQDLEWRHKEVKRVSKYYVPTSELTEPEAQKRRKYVNESTKEFRAKAQEIAAAACNVADKLFNQEPEFGGPSCSVATADSTEQNVSRPILLDEKWVLKCCNCHVFCK